MLFAGIDVGSTTSKCVLLREGKIVSSALVDMGIGTAGPERAYSQALSVAEAAPEEIACCAATGYGRATWKGADLTISELTAHGLGNHYLFPEARTVIDIGGQDAKVIQLDANGRMANFVMNDKCAAGTGRFLEVMANVLRIPIGDLEMLAAQGYLDRRYSEYCDHCICPVPAAGDSVWRQYDDWDRPSSL